MAGSRDRFGLVFLLLSTSFLLSAFVPGHPGRSLPALLYAVALVVLLRPSQLPERRWRWPGWILLLGALAGTSVSELTANRVVRGLASLWLAALLGFAMARVL